MSVLLYYARIDDAFYAGFSEEALRELIDASAARKEGKGPAKTEMIDVNTSLYLSPQAAFKAKEAFDAYLEWETHKRAWPNNAIIYALHRCNLLNEPSGGGKPAEFAQTALHFLGYVPVSPDGTYYVFDARTKEVTHAQHASYVFDAKMQEVVNTRHGSLRAPVLHPALREDSPVRQLVEQLKSLRVDLRFREDGVHTIVTIDRQ